MKSTDLLQLGFFIVLFLLLAWLLGWYMARVYTGARTFLDPILRPVERLFYRVSGVSPEHEMGWLEYAAAVLIFNILGIALLFLQLLVQGYLPFNPQHFLGMKWDLALNTAVSFVTNTNWQAYSGESAMSYLTQMYGLTVHNFVSAATGMAVAIALIRGLIRRQGNSIGNFWVDLTRSVLYILLPLAIIFALILVPQGVIQTLHPYATVQTLEGAQQTIAVGPVASQEAIKLLGTNGGGFFNANSAHPFENPTPLTNLLEMLAIFLISAGLVFTFGHMVGDRRQGHVILGAMLLMFVVFLGVCYYNEAAGNPLVSALHVSSPTAMEGKEVRFGIANSALFATVTTATSCGAVNTMHDSLTPLGGFVPMLQMKLGEVVIGGVGAGLYAMMIFVLLTVFIIGLMVGRTPEYLGKKIESMEIKMGILAILLPSACILIGAAIACVTKAGTSSILNPGPHGLSEILYAWASGAANNGSAFAGLNANTIFYNLGLSLDMFIGRFGVIIPVLAIAGSLVKKKIVPSGPGTFQTTGPFFAVVLAAVVIIVGALTFFPALALGPLVEHLLMWSGKVF
ncbi:MAG: potassium-transporting ATPase subunit KdpA [Thermacetogeniaceae bacterium]